ncbi:MAG: MBL fold metallo-hydrolase [Chloroflexi bacterium]|nr:MBL fold metallo-hydrolase [Chloroflexota bacterium]
MQQAASFPTSGGRTVYSFPVTAFPGLVANIYLVDNGDELILVDCGSGMAQSNQELLAGFDALREQFGVSFTLGDVDRIVITHGHIDHFGGLPFVREHTDAPIGVHILDRRVLSHYEERVLVAARRLTSFLIGAGIAPEQRDNLMAMYLFAKGSYRSTPVQFLLDEAELLAGIQVYHVPGHCPGQVCLRVDDVLLTADHVLAWTTPHQAPESITLSTGLGHYLQSLAAIRRLEGIRLALGGHEAPMADLCGRIDAITALHEERLSRVLELCHTPCTIAEISKQLFGAVRSYHVLLALEETGAHVEYLYQRGELIAANLDEVERQENPVLLYRRV